MVVWNVPVILLQATTEGLTLVASRRSGTGYKCVVYNTAYRKRPFNVQVRFPWLTLSIMGPSQQRPSG